MDTPSPRTSNVYVANLANLDYSQAEKFGSLVPFTKHYVKFNNIDGLTAKVSNDLTQVDPNIDYLILSGNNLICALVFHLWIKRFNYARILHWDTRSERYIVLTIGTDVLHILRGSGEFESSELVPSVEVPETQSVGEVQS